MRLPCPLPFAALLALCLLSPAQATSLPAAAEPAYSGWTLTLDNDAFVPRGKDKDYTGGFGFTVAGARVQDWPLSLHRLVDAGLDWGIDADYNGVLHGFRVGGLAFTPDDLASNEVVAADRPYATLLFFSSSVVRETRDGRAFHASLLLGVLGLDAMAEAQRGVHKIVGGTIARGWNHQISDGGEPTANLSLGRQGLLLRTTLPGYTALELKDSWDLSLGAETAAAYGLSLRLGRLHTPWWSQAPEQVGYLTPEAPAPYQAAPRGGELYFNGGARLKARAYSVFLQGQFRHSDHRLEHSDLRPLIGEAWGGITWQFLPRWRAGWVLRGQTSEIRGGAADRSLVYGGLFLSRDL